MSMNKIDGLFNRAKPSPEKELEDQKKLARELSEKANALGRRIWVIDLSLAKKADPNLLLEKKQIQHELDTEKYVEKYHALLEKIRDKEIELYGASEIGKSSPFTL